MTGPTRSGWQPTEIRRFIRNFDTGAGVILVLTDAGEGYLKAMGNVGGEHCLACEWVATHLARWFKLSTFDFSIIEVTDSDEVPFFRGGNARPGPAFITRSESGEPWGGKANQLNRLINPQDEDIVRSVPREWDVNPDARGALTELIVQRALYLAQNRTGIMGIQLHQRRLNLPGEREDNT
jgi:hypothetical protein